jgi:MarR family transcriptional regulator for hemolysin
MVEGPTVVATIDRLQAAGLIARTPSDTDRRIKLLVLTEAGQALYARVRTEAHAFRVSALSDIDQATLDGISDVLDKLRQRIELSL